MEQKEIKRHIDAIIEQTFEVLKDVYDSQKEPPKKTNKDYIKQKLHKNVGSRIIFPKYSDKYRDGKTRLSEQELRFIFVEQFNTYCNKEDQNWFYSVETPTEYKYVFSEDRTTKKVPRKVEEGEKGGESARFDLVIHDEQFNRIALLEFKALNPDKSSFTKDFLKLREERTENILTYFIMYIEAYKENKNNPIYDTIYSLNTKIFTEFKSDKTIFYCFVLAPKDGQEKQIENIIQNYKKPYS